MRRNSSKLINMTECKQQKKAKFKTNKETEKLQELQLLNV